MNDDDLLAPKLSPSPMSSPLVRAGAPLAAVVLVTGALVGCNPGEDPNVYRDGGADVGSVGVDGGPVVFDAGIQDTGPLVYDAGISPPDAASPGVRIDDAGVDATAPGVPPP